MGAEYAEGEGAATVASVVGTGAMVGSTIDGMLRLGVETIGAGAVVGFTVGISAKTPAAEELESADDAGTLIRAADTTDEEATGVVTAWVETLGIVVVPIANPGAVSYDPSASAVTVSTSVTMTSSTTISLFSNGAPRASLASKETKKAKPEKVVERILCDGCVLGNGRMGVFQSLLQTGDVKRDCLKISISLDWYSGTCMRGFLDSINE